MSRIWTGCNSCSGSVLRVFRRLSATSYGDDEQAVPLSFATAVCNGFAQLGARGVSLLFASGDNGVGSNGECVSNDGRSASMFLPIFPGSCVSIPLSLARYVVGR